MQRLAASRSPSSRLSFLGGFPQWVNLNAEVLSVEERAGCTQSLIEYNVIEGEQVQALLHYPEHPITNPTPGIVAIHQDGSRRPYDYGKSEVAGLAGDPSMAYGLELCQRGYMVICPDRFGVESRGLARSAFAEQFDDFRILGTSTGVDFTEDLFVGRQPTAYCSWTGPVWGRPCSS